MASAAAPKRKGIRRTLTRRGQQIGTDRKRSRSAREEAREYLRDEPTPYDNPAIVLERGRRSALHATGPEALLPCEHEAVNKSWLGSLPGSPGRGQLGSCIESEHDLVRFLVAPMGERAPLAHDTKAALGQHTNRRGVVARSASVKRTGCLQLPELL